MENILNIYVNEDDSVQKKLDKRAVKLQKKYYKRRKFNEKYVKYKSGLQQFFSKLGFFFGIVVVVVSVFLCFCNLMARVNNLVPSVGGYSTLKVETTSMTASGIKQFDTIVARACDETTIGEGDIIVFYVYWPSSYKFVNLNCERIDDSEIPELKYSVTKEEFIGIQNQEKKLAAKANAKRVVHQVIEVYEDYKGERWFKTKGTSNLTEDTWWINENYVIGAYDDSAVAATMSVVVNTMTSPVGSIVLLICPIIIIAFIIVFLSLKDLQIAMLENDIVEEKRKLTDDICIKNNVGYQMSQKTKYKVLALASDDEKMRYISLLWKDGGTPNAIKKYVLRKQLLLKSNIELRDLNRECERKFENGENPRKIALFYETQKQKIQDRYEKKRKKLKEIQKANLKARQEKEEQKRNKKRKKVKNQKPTLIEESVKVETVKTETENMNVENLKVETDIIQKEKIEGKPAAKKTANKKSPSKKSTDKK